ncbi:hypothetical protein GCM10010304_81980 [Streptomyces roseoviolaceus]
MYRIRPVANGTRTDHPAPGLPFVNDGRLPLDNPDAIERTGRNQGEGLWGRTDRMRDGGWVAFTTEPKNQAFAWAVYQHPVHGRIVLLIHDGDLGSLHHIWLYGRSGFLFRHGGYWWNGERWHRPGQAWDAAYERYDPRPVANQVTITAADLVKAPGTPQRASVSTIASFTAPEAPVANWHDHLALWAQHRAPGARPLEACVVDLHAPELEPDSLVDMTGLSKIAAVPAGDMPDLRYGGAKELPEPQDDSDGTMRWSTPVARDWAENYHQKNGPRALLSATTSYGATQPAGLVNSHNRLRKNFLEDLTEPRGKRRKPYLKGDEAREAADSLAWTAATSLMYGHDYGLIPHSPLRDVLVDAVVGQFTEDGERKRKTQKKEITLSDLSTSTVKMLTWYFQHHPDHTASILGEICLEARVRLGLAPAQVGNLLRRSFHMDSGLGEGIIDRLMDMALPPSANEG